MNDPAYFSESFETLRRASWKCYLMFSRTEFEQAQVLFFSPSILCIMTSHFLLIEFISQLALSSLNTDLHLKVCFLYKKHIERYYFQWLSRYTHRIYIFLIACNFFLHIWRKSSNFKVLYDTQLADRYSSFMSQGDSAMDTEEVRQCGLQ